MRRPGAGRGAGFRTSPERRGRARVGGRAVRRGGSEGPASREGRGSSSVGGGGRGFAAEGGSAWLRVSPPEASRAACSVLDLTGLRGPGAQAALLAAAQAGAAGPGAPLPLDVRHFSRPSPAPSLAGVRASLQRARNEGRQRLRKHLLKVDGHWRGEQGPLRASASVMMRSFQLSENGGRRVSSGYLL